MSTHDQKLIYELKSIDKIAEFNLYPIRYIHDSWLQKINHASLLVQLKKTKHSDFYLSQFILKKLNLNTIVDFNFQQPIKKIGLMSREYLWNLALHIGIVLNAKIFKNIVLKKEIIALNECLGKHMVEFAQKKASFINPMLMNKTPYFMIDWNHINHFKKYIIVSGIQAIANVFCKYPNAFKKRFMMKWPLKYQKIFIKSNDLSSDKIFTALILKVNREIGHYETDNSHY